jgi:ABC-type bacteriocin/lantibiotic exporter with double-glycine peptidase domain
MLALKIALRDESGSSRLHSHVQPDRPEYVFRPDPQKSKAMKNEVSGAFAPNRPDDGAEALPVSVKVDDTLLKSLVWMAAYHGKPTSEASMLAGLPTGRFISPKQAQLAIEQAGFTAGIIERQPNEVSQMLLPVVLFRKDHGGMVLIGRAPKDVKVIKPPSEIKEGAQPEVDEMEAAYLVVLPESGSKIVSIGVSQLKANYTGYAMLVKPVGRVDERAGKVEPSNDGHWLLSTLWRFRRYYWSAALGALLINVLALAGTFFTMNVYDRVVPNQAFTTLWSLAIGVSIAMLFEFISRNVRAHVLDVAGKKADLIMGAMLFRKALASALMKKPVEHDPEVQYLNNPTISGAIELKRVGFHYPSPGGMKPPEFLKDINININAGDRVAILGRVGSGKSSLLRVMSNLYRPTSGQVFSDGIDIKQIDPADWRVNVGYVSQDSRLFYGSLRENVMLGRPDASIHELLRVGKITGLDAVAAGSPHGWNLPIGENGDGLSGGQKQLVALARALIARPKLMLMDEPTSAMDTQTEAAFITHLNEATQGTTLVVVTHRPSLLQLVDRIIVIDGGRVVTDGPKEEVLAALRGPSGPAVTSAHHSDTQAQSVTKDAS